MCQSTLDFTNKQKKRYRERLVKDWTGLTAPATFWNCQSFTILIRIQSMIITSMASQKNNVLEIVQKLKCVEVLFVPLASGEA